MVASTLATMATPAAGAHREKTEEDTQESYVHLYLMVFLTVVVAILVEKAATKLFKVLQNQASDFAQPIDMRRTPGRKRPAEDDELLAAEIEEKDKMEWSKETALAFYERTRAMHLDYIDRTDRLEAEVGKHRRREGGGSADV